MCQVYYVRGFIELIYFVPVDFNQGQFMHTEWADAGDGRVGVTCIGMGLAQMQQQVCSKSPQ